MEDLEPVPSGRFAARRRAGLCPSRSLHRLHSLRDLARGLSSSCCWAQAPTRKTRACAQQQEEDSFLCWVRAIGSLPLIRGQPLRRKKP